MPQLLAPASFPFLFVSCAGRRKKLSNNPQYYIQPWLSVAHTVIYFPEEGKGLRGDGDVGAAALAPHGCFPLSNELLSRRATVSRRHGAVQTPRAGCGSAGEGSGHRGRPRRRPALRETRRGRSRAGEVWWSRGGGHVAGESGPAAAAPVAVRDGAGRAGRQGGREGEVRGAGAGAGREPGGASGRRPVCRRVVPRRGECGGRGAAMLGAGPQGGGAAGGGVCQAEPSRPGGCAGPRAAAGPFPFCSGGHLRTSERAGQRPAERSVFWGVGGPGAPPARAHP